MMSFSQYKLRPLRLLLASLVASGLIAVWIVGTRHSDDSHILDRLRQRYESTHIFSQDPSTALDPSHQQPVPLPPLRRPNYHGFSPYFKPFEGGELEYREVWSRSTTDGTYFNVYFTQGATKPNIIPHPTKADQYLLIATDSDGFHPFQQLNCQGSFYNGVLLCADPPTILPIPTTNTGTCAGALDHYNMRSGPRDSRVFYSPDGPLISYNAQSPHRCMGHFIQDIRHILPDFTGLAPSPLYANATEIHRPDAGTSIHKNFMLFWDAHGTAHVQHEFWPARMFAQLAPSGHVGPDLAPATRFPDLRCMARLMPPARGEFEWIRPGSNSLAVTLCRRADPRCVPTDKNTMLMHIVHHEKLTAGHATFEPYVVLFQRSAPFALHAMAQRPLWVRGRGVLTKATGAKQYEGEEAEAIPPGELESFETTTMSWMMHGQRYHGYLDDPLFLSFGIEDSKSAGADTTAAAILQDLAFC